MKVNSTIQPKEIQQHGKYIWLRTNIEEKQIQDDDRIYNIYEYNEVLLKDITLQEVENHFEDIFENPQNYNVIQIDGRYV